MFKDPVCGMTVSGDSPYRHQDKGKNHFFCSDRCRNTFLKRRTSNATPSFFPKASLISLGIFLLLFAVSFIFSSLAPLFESLLRYLKVVWWAIGLGIFLGSLLDYYVPREYISYFLAGHSRKTIFYAAFLGFLLSACSHGILALSMALYKKGASVAAVISFLLASPWANLSVTFLLLGLFGLKGVVLIVSAVVVALMTGVLFQELEKHRWVENNPNTLQLHDGVSISEDFKRRWRQKQWNRHTFQKDAYGVVRGMFLLSEMVLPWALLGVTLAGVVGAFVPIHLFTQFFGPNLLGLMVTLLSATVIEICSEGSSPLAFEIYHLGGAFGNSFVFLMAGVATDYTEIGLLWANIGKRTALWMILLTTPQILFLGYCFNRIF